ncbi:MAG: phosphatidylglycerol lysyltransferase domain-containing protein [Ktedonobacterales bacterium]
MRIPAYFRNWRRHGMTFALCCVACVNIFSTLFPIWPVRFHLLGRYLPLPVILGAQHLTLFLGVLMLLLALPAAQGHRRSAWLYLACAGAAILTNVVKGLDIEEALFNAIALGLLWSRRRSFDAIPLRYTLVDVARLGIALALMWRVYALLERAILGALRNLRNTVVQEGMEEPGVNHTVHMLTAHIGLQHLWFDESQAVLPVFLIGVFLVYSWTSLMRIRTMALDTSDLYARFGRHSHNSLAYIAHRDDVLTFLDPLGRGAISYRLVGRVALQVGAILAPAGQRDAVYAAFHAYCHSQRLIPAAIALSETERPIAQQQGLRAIPIGKEALVDLDEFAVEKLNKKMRWAQRSLAKRGYRAELLPAAAITCQLRAALQRIDAEWRDQRGGQMHGYSMTLGRFPTDSDNDCLIGLMRDSNDLPVAYLTLLPGGKGYYSLDLTRRLHAAPNAAMEFLLIETLGALKARGAATVSLNFSSFSGLASSRGGRLLRKVCGAAFQLDSLEAFNNKFRPTWAPRYLMLPSWYNAPDVFYAVLIIEGIDRVLLNALMRGVRRLVGGQAGAIRQRTPVAEPRIQGEGS